MCGRLHRERDTNLNYFKGEYTCNITCVKNVEGRNER